MASPGAWLDFTNENNAGKYRNAATLAKFRDRDLAMSHSTYAVLFPVVNYTGSSYPATANVKRRVFIGEAHYTWRLWLWASATSGGTGYIRGQLVGSVTKNSYDTQIVTTYPTYGLHSIEFYDVTGLQGQACYLNLFLRHTTGGTSYMATQGFQEDVIGANGSRYWA